MDSEIDITADSCPMTFVKVKLAMESLPAGASLVIRLNGGEPLKNVPASLRDEGYGVEPAVKDGEAYRLVATKPADAE
ncbi:MAG: sulfurtransferase TusA family protein [Magnetococcales bacterium]|nr:sulfurtransferase TusA family protein [Magnetococcales bacterium]